MNPKNGFGAALVLAGMALLIFTFASPATFAVIRSPGGGGACPISLIGATPEYGYVSFSGGACTSAGGIASAGTIVYYLFSGPGVSESGQTTVQGSEGGFSGSAAVPLSADGFYTLVVSVCPDAGTCAAYPSGGLSSLVLSIGQPTSTTSTTSTSTTTSSSNTSGNPLLFARYLAVGLMGAGLLMVVLVKPKDAGGE